MKSKERLDIFLKHQKDGIIFQDIAKELGIAEKTLRSFLNKSGYKLHRGRYVPKEEEKIDEGQMEFFNKEIEKDKNKKSNGQSNKKESTVTKKENSKKKETVQKKGTNLKQNNKSAKKEINTVTLKTKKSTVKKDRKINITQDDLDKLCEVYDWYLQLKDTKGMKVKKTINKKDISIEDKDIKEVKSASIKVDKNTWDDFERLCSNSEFTKKEILTQALKDFMKEYKHLL